MKTPSFRLPIAFVAFSMSCGGAPPAAEHVAAPPMSTAAPVATTAAPPTPPTGIGADALAAVIALRDAPPSESHATAIVQSITDEVGARLGGSEGDPKAVAWARKALTENGLTKVHSEAARVTHWERGAEEGSITQPASHRLALTALGGSVATPATGLEAEVVEAASLEALDKLDRAKVEGKIVFLDVVMERAKDGAGYGKAVGARGLGAIRAAKLGAVGFVIRSIGTDHNRLPHTGAMRYEDGVAKIPAAALSIPDAELLHRLVARGAPVRLRMSLGAKTLPDADSADVIGDVEGSSAPEEIVLLGAHLDSWDLGTGAIDDGAGCAIMIDAARRIAAMKHPRRTVRVVLFAGEENSGGGARAYAKAYEAELGRHVVAIEADFGAAPVLETRILSGPEGAAAFASLGGVLKALGVETSKERAFGGADIEPLLPFGVPLLDLRQDGTHYFDIHHTANDTFDKIVPDEIAKAANAYAAAAYFAASVEGAFGRVPKELRELKRR